MNYNFTVLSLFFPIIFPQKSICVTQETFWKIKWGDKEILYAVCSLGSDSGDMNSISAMNFSL